MADIQNPINSLKRVKRIARASETDQIKIFFDEEYVQTEKKTCPFIQNNPSPYDFNYDFNDESTKEKDKKNNEDENEIMTFDPEHNVMIYNPMKGKSHINLMDTFTETSRKQLENVNLGYTRLESLKQKQKDGIVQNDEILQIEQILEKQILKLKLKKISPLLTHSLLDPFKFMLDNKSYKQVDCHKIETCCYLNLGNRIKSIQFSEKNEQTKIRKINNNFLYQNQNIYSTLSTCDGIISNILMTATVQEPSLLCFNIDNEKQTKNYHLSEFASHINQHQFDIFTGLSNGNIVQFDYRVQIQIQNFQRQINKHQYHI